MSVVTGAAEFVCGTHGVFAADVPASRMPCTSAGCLAPVPVLTPLDYAHKGRCCSVSLRADINHDPGDEDRP